MHHYKLSSSKIKIDLQQVIYSMGYSSENISVGLDDMLLQLYKNFKKIVKPECGFIIPSNNEIKNFGSGIICNNVKFNTGSKIASRLKNIDGCLLFVVTLGHKIDSWIQELVDADDIHSAYLVDMIATEFIEKLSEWIEVKIKNKVGDNLGYSYRYGPGYCDWDLREQKKLFNFFPKDFCGITLSDSSMMKPRKSLSGIIGYGKDFEPLKLPCDVCQDIFCHKNQNVMKKNNNN